MFLKNVNWHRKTAADVTLIKKKMTTFYEGQLQGNSSLHIKRLLYSQSSEEFVPAKPTIPLKISYGFWPFSVFLLYFHGLIMKFCVDCLPLIHEVRASQHNWQSELLCRIQHHVISWQCDDNESVALLPTSDFSFLPETTYYMTEIVAMGV